MADPVFRVAVIGYGLAGSCFHAPFIATTPGLRLTAIVTGDAERQARARRDHPRARIVASADQLWTDAASLDVVVIASPNRAHVPLARAALRAGLVAVVDKPLAATAAEARQLIDEFKTAGKLLTVFQNRRWDGDFQTLRQLMANGDLGDLWRFESRFERWRPDPAPGWRHSSAPEDAGGLLYDLGAHLIDQATLLFGPVTQIYAELDRRNSHAVVDDDTFVALTHQSGVRSHLFMSANAAQVGPRFRVLGSKAAYVKFDLDVQEAALRDGHTPGGSGWGQEPPDRWGLLGAGEALERVPTVPGNYGLFYRGLVSALAGEAPPPVDPEDSARVLDVIEAVRSGVRSLNFEV